MFVNPFKFSPPQDDEPAPVEYKTPKAKTRKRAPQTDNKTRRSQRERKYNQSLRKNSSHAGLVSQKAARLSRDQYQQATYNTKTRRTSNSSRGSRGSLTRGPLNQDINTKKQQIIRYANQISFKHLTTLVRLASMNSPVLLSLQIFAEIQSCFVFDSDNEPYEHPIYNDLSLNDVNLMISGPTIISEMISVASKLERGAYNAPLLNGIMRDERVRAHIESEVRLGKRKLPELKKLHMYMVAIRKYVIRKRA